MLSVGVCVSKKTNLHISLQSMHTMFTSGVSVIRGTLLQRLLFFVAVMHVQTRRSSEVGWEGRGMQVNNILDRT